MSGAARTGEQPRRALARGIPRIQIGSAGTWAPGPECLKRGARLAPQPAVSGSSHPIAVRLLSHIATLATRGCSGFAKVGQRASEPHSRRPLKPTGLRLVSLGGKKAQKTSHLPVPLGCAVRSLGCTRDSVVRPGDLRLSPAEHEVRPLSNKPVAIRAPSGALGRFGEPFPALADLRLSPAGCEEHPPSNKPLAT